MPFSIVRGDITKFHADAVVNAANTALEMGGGVCGAIFRAAGADALQAACKRLAPIKTGDAVITPGFQLPARYIIHTAGPLYRGGHQGEEALLRACYTNSLALARQHGCQSIAFALISSGIYGYPKGEALRVATSAIRDFLGAHDMDVSLVVPDPASLAVSADLLSAVEGYLNAHYVEDDIFQLCKSFSMDSAGPQAETACFEQVAQEVAPAQSPLRESLDDLVTKLDESFSSTLLRLIDATGKSDAQVYRRANIDRRLFSKIRSSEHYAPSKPTVLAFAVALELKIAQTEDLLERAGFALSHSRKFDVIVEYFIRNERFDIFEINEVLFRYDQPLLGG